MKTKKSLINYFVLFSGILSAVFYLLHDIIGAANYPGYDWKSQAVSDLTATDAPSFAIAGGFAMFMESLAVYAVRFFVS